ncbi:hypothetical protein PL263_00095 [Methylomonas sp. EFPC3]|uniref:hypothetical protein n=1 Tax=Methylomonas sp. EFPC3 TaxID=3021710 RepID=UPI002416A52B|nr:hypothetical protein [Methylomonas sp. EFPC3]WFP50441.1 hypothetical protein PL263_00095 [Methylomonas sp. EFPC3]
MISEFIHYLGTRAASPGARRLGYAGETAALETRHRRCRKAWQAHLASTRAALLSAAERAGPNRACALIGGGGSVHDLPVAELLDRFDRLVLLDICFGPGARRLSRRWPQRVHCCPHDVTGIVDWLAKHRRLPPAELLSHLALPQLDTPPDWVASVNCLTQLPVLPIAYLASRVTDENLLEAFGRELVQTHLRWLQAWQVPICLITEVEDRHFDRHDALTGRMDYRSLLHGFQTDAACIGQWPWQIHPPGELAGGRHEIRIIEAWCT